MRQNRDMRNTRKSASNCVNWLHSSFTNGISRLVMALVGKSFLFFSLSSAASISNGIFGYSFQRKRKRKVCPLDERMCKRKRERLIVKSAGKFIMILQKQWIQR